ncbi:MAG: HlyD family type I secretion periplasmic adaptor subunit [Pseudomonadota bacterium]
MAKLDDLLARQGSTTWRPLAWAVMLMVGAGIAWAALAKLDEVAVAEGEVVPLDKVKVIQHLEGGLIEEIFVKEGQVVAAGDALFQLKLPVSGLNREELQVQLDGLLLTQSRLASEAAGEAVALPETAAARRPDLAAIEQQAHDARKAELVSELEALNDQTAQRGLAIKELQAARQALRVDLGMARKHLAISSDLVKDGLTSQVEHLQREREVKRLEGELSALKPAIPRAEAALQEAEQRIEQAKLTFHRQVMEELRETEIEIARTRELLDVATDQDLRTVVRSPEEGIVKNLRYHTIGGVVGPGEAIMEIVPSRGNLVIEARLSPADRGHVAVGQSARAKISTYDFIRYGVLDGKIVQISADSTTSAEGEPFYRVVMEPERAHLGDSAGQFPIMPGMVVTLDIKTGRKSILSFIIEPVLRIREEAFRERS